MSVESKMSNGSTISKADLRASTKARKGFSIFTAVLFFIAMVFLIMINIGNTSNKHVLGDLYFFKLDVSNIIPSSYPQSQLINSLARSIGLHDFYQVGLWNFCEGYNDVGITACSQPVTLYWFNPVQILLDELLDGATSKLNSFQPLQVPQTNPAPVTLPNEVVDYLNILRTASHVMFGCFFASTITSFICIFLCPLAVYSRLTSIPIAFFALCTGLMTLIATGISTGMWVIFRNSVDTYAADIHIVASLGTKMFVFQWIATGCAVVAALGQVGMCCCGTSRRDIKTGRRVGRRMRTEKAVAVEENPALRRRWWGSVST
jgi:hypothetical protein